MGGKRPSGWTHRYCGAKPTGRKRLCYAIILLISKALRFMHTFRLSIAAVAAWAILWQAS
jgi:hypothetical protein